MKGARILLEIFKKAFDKFDVPIVLVGVLLFLQFDFGNLSTFDKIYIATFAFWTVTKIIAVYIVWNNERDKKNSRE